MQALIPAAQYQRMSTEQQMYSLANQGAAIAAYAQEHGFEIIKTYCDAGKSGITTKGRNGLKSLLADGLASASSIRTDSFPRALISNNNLDRCVKPMRPPA